MPPNLCLRRMPMLPDNLGILWKVAFLDKSEYSKLNKVQPLKNGQNIFFYSKNVS
jgi:hypothetical protein